MLRVYAVFLVLYGNGTVLVFGQGRGLWGLPFEKAGLAILFAVSGYLTGCSLTETPDLRQFAVRRAARLFPALFVCVIVTMLVIGPLATTLPLRSYLLSHLTMRYIENAVLIPKLFLPQVFTGQEWGGMVNPMLLTLVPGIIGWAASAVLWRVPVGARPWRFAGLALFCGIVSFTLLGPGSDASSGLPRKLLPILAMLAFFFTGTAIRAFERSASARLRADIAILCFAANWTIAGWIGAGTTPLLWFTIPYMAAAFGQLSGPGLAQIAAVGNPSFGIYLYAFPVQQLIVARWPHCAHPILLCAIIALLLGYLSWHLVENPAQIYLRRLWPDAPSTERAERK